MLERMFAKVPDHPGLAHYIIHAYDVPPLAPRALDAARRYAQIAPAAPHALHMPSHTFTRVGYWRESVESNLASAAAAKREGTTAEQLHALDYQTYAYLQMAQDDAVRRIVEEVPAIVANLNAPTAGGGAAPVTAGGYAGSAIPARYALERGDWAGAAALAPIDHAAPQAQAVTHFAKAIGAARAGKPSTIDADVARLTELRDELTAKKDAYWAGQVEIQRVMASAWLAWTAGRRGSAFAGSAGGRRGGCDQKGCRLARSDRARARDAGRHAARIGSGRRRADSLRAGPEERAAPLPCRVCAGSPPSAPAIRRARVSLPLRWSLSVRKRTRWL